MTSYLPWVITITLAVYLSFFFFYGDEVFDDDCSNGGIFDKIGCFTQFVTFSGTDDISGWFQFVLIMIITVPWILLVLDVLLP